MCTNKMAEGSGDFCAVAKLSELKRTGRTRITLNGRVIALFYVGGDVYALDHFCYHNGGPLALGDIEDSHGRMCVLCPWHRHAITLDTGESLYTAIDPANPRVKRHNCSKGVKQRTHHVKVDVGQDCVYVKVSDLSKPTDSDRYFSEEYRVFMENALDEPTPEQLAAVKVPIHSSRLK